MNQLLKNDTRKSFNAPLRRLPKIRSGVTLIWIETSRPSASSTNGKENLCLAYSLNHCNTLRCSSISKAMKYIKKARLYEQIILVMNLQDFSETDSEIPSHWRQFIKDSEQIRSILIISLFDNENDHSIARFKTDGSYYTDKVAGIYKDYESALVVLQALISDLEETEDESPLLFSNNEKSLKDVRHNLIGFLCSHSYRVILQTMPYKSPKAKREMLKEIRSECRATSHQSAAIDTFIRTYDSADAINWYTKSSFLYEIVNRKLRTGDIRALYLFRYYILDLCMCLKNMSMITRNKFTKSFVCYRGSKMKVEELEQLCINTLVSTNGFWSSSRDLCVARVFAGLDDTTGMPTNKTQRSKRQSVLFEIHVDFDRSPGLVVADVSHLSDFKDENEVLFDLGTTFQITGKTYDERHNVWNIQMSSSAEVDILDRDYDSYVRQRLLNTSGEMLYGNLLAGALCDYAEAASYFQGLLRQSSLNNEDRPNIYLQLGRTYRLMGKYDLAIGYFRASLLLLRRYLPQLNFDYAYALSGLGAVYSELGDPVRAIHLHNRALAVYRTLFPENHLEINQILNRIAYDLCQSGQYTEAFALLSKFDVTTTENILLTNPRAQIFHTMGLVYKGLGNRTKALHYLENALDFREKWSHKFHPYTALICYELALLYAQDDQKLDLALKYAQRSLTIHRSRASPNNFVVNQSVELIERLTRLISSNCLNSKSNCH